MNPTEETKQDIVGQFVAECQNESDQQILCDWVTQLAGNNPVCGANQEWRGCANECDLRTCDDQLDGVTCINPLNPVSTCVCSSGFFLQNGECVAEAECGGVEWTNW